MLVAAAVCPHPPLLVPELASGAIDDLADLRAACDTAVAALTAATPDRLLVIGSTIPQPGGNPPAVAPLPPARFAAYGPRPGDDTAPADAPLSLLVGRWLLDRVGYPSDRAGGLAVPADLPPADCAALGRDLAGSADRTALLVLGDGSARRATAEPGAPDPAADAFDAAAAVALAAGDPAGLLALDPARAAEVHAVGRAPWQVLAGAAEPGPWRAELTHDSIPAEVRYLVATWLPG